MLSNLWLVGPPSEKGTVTGWPLFFTSHAPPFLSVMPTSASAKKRLRQSQDRRLKNRAVRTNLRGQVKKVRAAIAAGEIEKSETEFKLATKKLDKAAAKGLLHANAAARTKSRLSKAIKLAKQA